MDFLRIALPARVTGTRPLSSSGQLRYTLKTPYRDGTTHIVREPLDLMACLAVLVPPPWMHLMRYHGVFAPHNIGRAAVTPAGRGAGRILRILLAVWRASLAALRELSPHLISPRMSGGAANLVIQAPPQVSGPGHEVSHHSTTLAQVLKTERI